MGFKSLILGWKLQNWKGQGQSNLPGGLKHPEYFYIVSVTCYNVGPPVDSVQLVHITAISLWFMVLITIVSIVTGAYNYNWVAPHCRVINIGHGHNFHFCSTEKPPKSEK
jgi:hypothetical protein